MKTRADLLVRISDFDVSKAHFLARKSSGIAHMPFFIRSGSFRIIMQKYATYP